MTRVSIKLAIRGSVVFAALLAAPALLFGGCRATYPNRDPVGEAFPSVAGTSLDKERVELPAALAGRSAIVLVGYRQGAQFDIDRWVIGLLQAGAADHASIVEVPTIPGLAPTIASRWIDDGMRSGIPEEDWGSVVTLYGDSAKPVARFTGTEQGRLARVLVLDAEGRVIWFDDGAFSPRKAIAVAELVGSLTE